MASRQNIEARDIPSYGAPLGPPKPSPEREQRRKEKLATKPTAEERRERIREHEEAAREESDKLAQEQANRRTQAPKPSAYTRIGETTGKSPAEILAERGEDVGKAIDVGEGVAPEEPAVVTAPTAKRRPIRERNRPKQ